jgi:lipopolysaccharide heptosyltransferase II
MSWKNWILSKVASLVRGQNPDVPKFLIVSTTGLGDTLWATPAIRALKDRYPESYLAVLTRPLGRELLSNNPHIDEIFIAKSPILLSLLRLLLPLRRRKFGTIFLFHASQRSLLPFCKLLGASHIIGTSGLSKGLDHLLTEAVPSSSAHEAERRMALVRGRGPMKLELFLAPEERSQVERLLGPVPAYIPIVGLQPGAKDRFKQWPKEHFIALGKRLQDHFGCHIIVTGGADERPLIEGIAREIPGAVVWNPRESIRLLAAIMERMTLFVSNDTGPMHLACAVNTPVIALFTPTDPKICGPIHARRATIIEKRPTCTPCLKKRCLSPFCLRQISVDEVFEASLKQMYGSLI